MNPLTMNLDIHGKPLADVSGMFYPVLHVRCNKVHDAGNVKVIARYADCDIWECPNCHEQCDNRPIGWGGNVKPLDQYGRIK